MGLTKVFIWITFPRELGKEPLFNISRHNLVIQIKDRFKDLNDETSFFLKCKVGNYFPETKFSLK